MKRLLSILKQTAGTWTRLTSAEQNAVMLIVGLITLGLIVKIWHSSI